MNVGDGEALDRFVTVPGGEIFTRTWAVEGGESPIVLLHDSLGSVDLWGSFPESLAASAGRSVIAYDRLGFGRSSQRYEPPSSNFILEEAEIYFPALKRQLAIDDFCLFGHSVGGGMAIAIATRFQSECRALVSESAQAFIEELTLEGVRIAKKRFENPRIFDKLKRVHGERARWVLEAWTETWLSDAFANWSLGDLLPEVRSALLVIHGDRDDYGSIAFADFIGSAAGGESRVEIISDCGHIPHREKPELILELTSKFLAGR